MQAIVTKYLSPTDRRGTRIKATASAGSITLGYRYDLDIEGNHREAAKVLAMKYNWLETNRCAVCGVAGPNHGAKKVGVFGTEDHWFKAATVTLHGGGLANGDYVWVMIEA